jgi:MFS family permease
MTVVTSAWPVPQFRKVWGAGLFSGLGAEVGELALPSLALITLNATAAEASWVRAALLAPFLLMTLWLGVFVDRRRRRPLMIVAELGRGAILAILCVLAVLGWLTIPMLVAATFALGTLTMLYQLADFSFLPQIVGEHQLVDANAKVTATQSAVSIAGSGLGGTLVQLLTAPIAVAANAVGYLSSALLIGRIQAVEEPPARQVGTSAVREAHAGLRALFRHRVLRALVAEASLWNFGNEVFMLALSVHILDNVAAGPLALGIIVTCGGLGAFAGSLLSARLTARYGYGRSLVVSMLVGNTAPLVGVLAAIASPSGAVALLALAFALSGTGIGVANSQSTAIRQIAITADLRGRVNAGYRLLSWGALSLGALLGGALTTALGPWPAAVAGTLLMACATIPIACSPVRRVRAIEEVEQQPSRLPVRV